jgi:hypothetical protein
MGPIIREELANLLSCAGCSGIVRKSAHQTARIGLLRFRRRIYFVEAGWFHAVLRNKYDRALLHSRRSGRRPTLENLYIETPNDGPDWQQLAQENGSLRSIIAELLIKNQNLRWELQARGSRAGQDPGLLTASAGTPLRRKLSTVGIP